MTINTKHDSAPQIDMAAQLERMVCGELDEQARAPLIAWLDAEPRRWRMCGLLFLESQTWSEALKDWPAQHPSGQPAKPMLTRSNPPARGTLRRLRDAAVLAASVLVAFVLGSAMQQDQLERGAPSARVKNTANIDDTQTVARTGSESAPVMAMLPARSRAGVSVLPALHIPVVPGNMSAAQSDGGTSAIPDYVRQQWARRGYQLDIERRFLLAKLPDGQQVAVPFEQYSIKPIPPKVN